MKLASFEAQGAESFVIVRDGGVIVAGSFTRTVAVPAGDTIHADYGDSGGIAVHFS